MSLRTQITAFRVVAIAEALSWLGLLTGMYFKHVAETTEAGVKLFGPIHGGIFIGYVVLAVVLARRLSWSRGTTVLALAAAIPPFATVAFEVWAKRTGRLEAAAQTDELVPTG
jgi:RND superfamily putative drug exporter